MNAEPTKLILTVKPFTAMDAREWGLVNEVFALPELLPAAPATAARIARSAPISVRQERTIFVAAMSRSKRDQSNKLGVWFTTAPSIASIFSFVTTPPLAEKPPGLLPAASTR